MINNLEKEIPHIAFNSNKNMDFGIEVISIESLVTKSKELKHDPEKPHQVAFNMILLFTEGKSKHLVDFVWHEVKENTLIHLSKGQINAFKFNVNLKGFLILFTNEYLQNQFNTLPEATITHLLKSHLFSPKIEVLESSNVSVYIQLLNDEFYAGSDEINKRYTINFLFNIIFSKLEVLKRDQTTYTIKTEKLEVFLKFEALLEENYMKSRNADFYAEKLNITYKHLNVISREITNNTIKQFIDEFIVLEAKRKLINSSIRSNELAFLMGFSEPTNFIKYFKKMTGLTPKSFKNKHR